MTSVDNRVVQMEFDNSQFERNIQQSIKSLQNLDQSLELKNGEKGLNSIQKAAGRLDFSGVSSKVGVIGTAFESVKERALSVFSGITSAATMMGKVTGGIVAGLGATAIGLAATGGIRRAMNIEQAKFQLKGLGVAWEAIEDDINYAVKGTAYGLDSAAKAASQLIASNVQIGDSMKAALRGISGVAAMTNSDYDSIAHIFTAIAGQGKVMTIQLRQLELRGLNASAKLAERLGKTEAEIRDMVSKGEIDFNTFADAMDWAFGEHAKDANETFTGSLSNVKAALSRIGADFAASGMERLREIFVSLIGVIDDFHQATKPLAGFFDEVFGDAASHLTTYLDQLNSSDVFVSLGEQIDGFIQRLHTVKDSAGRDVQVDWGSITNHWWKGLKNISKTVDDVFGAVRSAFEGVFPPMDITGETIRELGRDFEQFTKKLRPSKETIETIKSTFTALFQILQKVGTVLGGIGRGLGNALSPVIDGLKGIGKGALKGLSDFIIGLNNFSPSLEGVSSALRDKGFNRLADFAEQLEGLDFSAEGLASAFESLGTMIGGFFSDIGKNLPTMEDIKNVFGGIADQISSFFTNLNVFQRGDGEGGLISGIFGGIQEAIKGIGDTLATLGQSIWDTGVFQGIFGFLEEKLRGMTIGDVFAAMNVTFLAGFIADIAPLIERLKKLLSFDEINITKILGLEGPLNMLKDAFKVWQTQLNMRALRTIAVSILIIAVAMNVLAGIPIEGVIQAAAGIWFIALLLTKAMIALAEAIDNPEVAVGLSKLTGIMVGIGVSVYILASAMKKIGSLDPEAFGRSVLGIVIAMGSLVMVAEALSKLKSKIGTGAMSLIAISAAFVIMAGAMKILSSIDMNGMLTAVFGMITIVGAIATLLLIMSLIKEGKILSSTAAIAVMAGAFVAMSMSMKLLSTMDMNGMLTAVFGMITIVGAIATLLLVMSLIKEGNIVRAILAISAMAGAFVAMASVMKLLSTMDMNGMLTAVFGMITIVGAIATLLLVMETMKEGRILSATAAIAVIAGAFTLMAGSMKFLSTMSWEGLAISVTALISVLTGLLLALYLAGDSKMLVGSAGLLVASVALAALAGSMKLLSTIPFEGVASALVVLGGSLLILGLAAAFIPIPALFALSGALVVIGVAVTALGAGIALAATGFLIFVTALTLAANIGVSAADALGTAIEVMTEHIANSMVIISKAIADSIKAFVEALGENAPEIAAASENIFTAFIDGANSTLPKLVAFGTGAILAFLEGIALQAGAIAAAGLNIVSNLLLGIAAGIGELVNAAMVLVIMLLTGIGDALRNNAGMLYDAVSSVMGTIFSLVEHFIADMIEQIFGPNPIADAIRDNADGLEAEAEAASKRVHDAFDEQYGETVKGAEEMMEGVSEAVDEGSAGIEGSVSEGGESIRSSFMDPMSMLPQEAKDLMSQAGVDIDSVDFAGFGSSAGGKFEGSMLGKVEETKTQAVSKVESMASEMGKVDASGSGNTVGSNFGQGVYNGIDSWVSSVASKAAQMVRDAKKAANDEQAAASPSKDMMKSGGWFAEGFMIGISNMIPAVSRTASSMVASAKSEVDGIGFAIADALDAIDWDSEPTIKPVLDLSDVEYGIGRMNRLMVGNNVMSATMIGTTQPASLAQPSIVKSGNTIQISLNYDAGANANDLVMGMANIIKTRGLMEA